MSTRVAADERTADWTRFLVAWGVSVAAILLLLRDDTAHLLHIWWNTSTFGHCLLVPPIIGWLVWQRRAGLARLTPRPWLPAAAIVIAAGAVWLVGHLAGVALVRHAGLVFMLMATVPTVFGPTVTRAVTFPLAYALFMIPVGEQLIPYLQTITAKFSIVMLDLFRVPAFIDGVFISIPTGDFEVAEACSGVRFLIAMVAFSVLVANVCFVSWTRRIVFVATAIALAILANGLRAWGTIYIAHLTTPEFARGVDHVVYGWFFFAVVLVLVMAVGWKFFDRPADDPFIDPARLQPVPPAPAAPRAVAIAAAATVALAAAAPVYALWMDSHAVAQPTERLALSPPPGWRPAAFSGTPWEPHYKGASATRLASFVDGEGQVVELYVAVFDRQGEGHELVGYGQGIIKPLNEDVAGWGWAGNAAPVAGGTAAQVNYGGAVRDAWQWYIVNGRVVASPYQAKIEGLKAKLFNGPPMAATVVISAQRRDPLVSTAPALDRLRKALGAPDAVVARALADGRR